MTLWPLGEISRAVQCAGQAIARAVETRHVATLAFAYGYKALFEMMRGNALEESGLADALLVLAREHAMPQWFAIGTFAQGWARWHAGDRYVGSNAMRDGMTLFNEQRIRFAAPLCSGVLAAVEAASGHTDVALANLNDALAEVEINGQHHFTAELYRQRGELLNHERRPGTTGEADLARAIEVARRQSARSFELRACTSLARLWRDQGKHAEARDLLAPVYGWFTEGFETPDLKQAKAVLAAAR